MKPRPPRVAEWLMARTLAGAGDRDGVLGDLAEEHAQLTRTRGSLRARGWYWGQTLRSIVPNLRRLGLAAGARTDLRDALRSIVRRPGFAVTASLTAGLGIAAATAVFAVVDATVVHALRLPDQDRVVTVWSVFVRHPGQDFAVSAAEFTDLANDVHGFERTGAWALGTAVFAPEQGGPARTLDVAYTIGDIYTIVGARAIAGRLPAAADDRPEAPPVALISYGLWRDAYGGDPRIFGDRTLSIGAQSVDIIGALAPGVALPGTNADVWVHTVLDPASWTADRSGHGLTVLARLRRGTSVEAARAEFSTLQQRWAVRYAGRHTFGLDGHAARLESIRDRMLGRAKQAGLLLSIAAALLLALACANVANLLLARGQRRAGDTGVRAALGATRWRVMQPLLFEGLLLGAIGGATGVAATAFLLPLLLRLAPADISAATTAPMSTRVIAFAAIASIVTGLAFTVAPAWAAARRAPSDLLRTTGRSPTRATRGVRTLVACQTALATALVVAALLLGASLRQLTSVDPGIAVAGRVAADLVLSPGHYRDIGAISGFYETVLDRVGGLPGVGVVSAVRTLPLRDPLRNENVLPEGATAQADRIGVAVQAAAPDVLRALGIPLLEGRDLRAADRSGSLRVALVNATAARALWPGESAIGKRLRGTFLPDSEGPMTIVGVYGDVRTAGLSTASTGELILPLLQADGMTGWVRNMTVVAQTAGDPDSLIPAIRHAVAGVDPGVAVERPVALRDVWRASVARERFLAALLAAFSALAVGIASVGVFGVVSFAVARQRRELAIRKALGAQSLEILVGVLRRHLTVAAAGATVGTLVAALAAPALRSFLYLVAPRSGAVLLAAPLALVTVALAAALGPALRAIRQPAAAALRDGD